MNEFIAQQIAKHDYPQHCDECGAWLSTQTDQTLHAQWHTALNNVIHEVMQTATHADAFHRLYKGKPA